MIFDIDLTIKKEMNLLVAIVICRAVLYILTSCGGAYYSNVCNYTKWHHNVYWINERQRKSVEGNMSQVSVYPSIERRKGWSTPPATPRTPPQATPPRNILSSPLACKETSRRFTSAARLRDVSTNLSVLFVSGKLKLDRDWYV